MQRDEEHRGRIGIGIVREPGVDGGEEGARLDEDGAVGDGRIGVWGGGAPRSGVRRRSCAASGVEGEDAGGGEARLERGREVALPRADVDDAQGGRGKRRGRSMRATSCAFFGDMPCAARMESGGASSGTGARGAGSVRGRAAMGAASSTGRTVGPSVRAAREDVRGACGDAEGGGREHVRLGGS